MKYSIITFLLVSIASLGYNCSGSSTTNKTVNGKSLFTTYCVSCHGKKGDLGLNGAKNLQESQLSLQSRITIITKGKNNMAAFEGIMTDEEIQAVAAYSITLKQ